MPTVTLTQDAALDGKRYEAGEQELSQAQAKAARELGVVAENQKAKAGKQSEPTDKAEE